MKKILIILPKIPYPLTSGGSQGCFHMLQYIKDFYDVYIWFHVKNGKKSEGVIKSFKEAMDNKCHVYYSSSKIGRNLVTCRFVCSLFEKWFLKHDPQFMHLQIIGDGASRITNLEVIEQINGIIRDNDIQYVQMEFPECLPFVYALPSNVTKIYVHHEIAFVRALTLRQNLREKFIFDDYLCRKIKSEEIAALNNYDLVISLTDVDKQKLIEAGVRTRVESSSLFIPPKSEVYPAFAKSVRRLTFVAASGHLPNQEGLKWFLNSIHPLLIKKYNYELDVVGKGWSSESMGIKVPSNVKFKGYIEDLSSCLPGSIMIVPILSGSGMRMKILESINNSVPFVSTSLGAEGLEFVSGRDCYIADNPSSFVDSICDLLNDEKMQSQFVENARNVYERLYSPSVLSQKRVSILESIML